MKREECVVGQTVYGAWCWGDLGNLSVVAVKQAGPFAVFSERGNFFDYHEIHATRGEAIAALIAKYEKDVADAQARLDLVRATVATATWSEQ